MKNELLEEVVVALLAVNNYPLDKAWKLLPALREAGLTKPESVPSDAGEATVKLAAAGYDRGLLTSMFAERIQGLMQAAQSGDLDGLEGLVREGKKAEAAAVLCKVKGIGPRVAETAWMLWQSPAT